MASSSGRFAREASRFMYEEAVEAMTRVSGRVVGRSWFVFVVGIRNISVFSYLPRGVSEANKLWRLYISGGRSGRIDVKAGSRGA